MKDNFGKWRTYSLFYEHRRKTYPFYWTLKERAISKEGNNIPSLKEIYLSYSHIPGSEYSFATEIIGSWLQWQRLCRSGLKPFIKEWRDELEIKIQATAMRSIIECSSDKMASSFQASKYLADKGYVPMRGRPTKEEKANAISQDRDVAHEIQDDLERVGLRIIDKG